MRCETRPPSHRPRALAGPLALLASLLLLAGCASPGGPGQAGTAPPDAARPDAVLAPPDQL